MAVNAVPTANRRSSFLRGVTVRILDDKPA